MAETNINYRLVYEQRCRSMPFESRLQLAQNSQGEVLLALCFDPAVVIITAIIRNPHATVQHARLIARHHNTTTGLMALGQKSAFLYDEGVRSALMKNPLSSSATLARFLATYNLFAVAKTINSHETTGVALTQARAVIKGKMQSADPAEVVYFIVQSGGRSLKELGGESLPQEVINRLCAMKFFSWDLVNNLINDYPALPPRLIDCLLRRPAAKYDASLKQRLRAHPHCPSELKK